MHAHAGVVANDAAQPLIKEGSVAMSKGQYQLALEKFSAAVKADPQASEPLSHIAHVLLLAAESASGEQAARLRKQAEGAVRQALRLGPNDPLAQEVQRLLEDGEGPPLRKASPEAWKLVQEGEILFQSGQYDEARAKYESAAKLDPQYSVAWLYAGDCLFAQKNWAEAEVRYRKAAEAEPINGQAWRFLSDALAWQGKVNSAEEALLKGISAQPGQRPSWSKLANLRAKAGYPMTSLKLEPKASGVLDAESGKYSVNVNANEGDEKTSPDIAVWMTLALNDVKHRMEVQQNKSSQSQFDADLEAWTAAMKVADEGDANGNPLKEPGLQTMQMLYKADQLEPALLLLRYKEAYRPELEAWKKEHPHGVRTFIATYALTP
ncbi:MAG: tetratricopeptide repeat protein [Paucibacter sp.]|nr:tetratricopeptide repeat protein [Roseateles sp.]